MPTIAIVAGEASGDASGAMLAEEIRKIRPDVTFWGAGGPKMREAGVEMVADFSWAGAIGIAESLKLVPRLLCDIAKLKRVFVERETEAFVPIDFGAFNMKLGRFARTRGIKTVYYFPPGSWRKRPRDPANLLAACDRIITPFPWSQDNLARAGADVVFPGHPMLDRVEPELTEDDFRALVQASPGERILGLLPGSRSHEISNILPTLLDSAKIISKSVPAVGKYVIAAGSEQSEARIRSIVRKRGSGLPDCRVVRGITYDVMAHSDLLITCSGTATLEAMILGTPMVIVYRGSRLMTLEYLLRKRILEEFIGMPNIVAGRKICPELIADEASPEAISRLAIDLLSDAQSMARMTEELRLSREILGQPGGTRRSAQLVLEAAGL